MIRKFFPLVIAAMIFSSCGSKTNKEASNKSKNPEPAVKIEFTALAENPENYIDKNIIVEGKVVHVCPHTGKKMFIVGENPDIMLYVSAGENTPKFPMELLGTEISVEGKITRAVTSEKPAETEMNTGTESKACCDSASKAVNAAECETEAAHAKQSTLADLMMIYNRHEIK